MKTILIVEDSQEKARNITKAIRALPFGTQIDISRVSNTIEATKLLVQNQYDVMILDLVIPLRDETVPDPSNAIAFLKEIRSRNNLNKPLVIIGTTEYDSSFDEWRDAFESDLWYLLLTKPLDLLWIGRLTRRLIYLFESIEGFQKSLSFQSKAEVCIITTVSVETKHLLKWLKPSEVIRPKDDCVSYYCRTVQIPNGKKASDVRVVGVETGIKGMAAASALATKCIYEFRPKWIVIIGIVAQHQVPWVVGAVAGFPEICSQEHSGYICKLSERELGHGT